MLPVEGMNLTPVLHPYTTHWALALDTATAPGPLALAFELATATPLPVAWALLLEMAVPPRVASAVEVATAAAISLRPVAGERLQVS